MKTYRITWTWTKIIIVVGPFDVDAKEADAANASVVAASPYSVTEFDHFDEGVNPFDDDKA
jgi:hypothetical protein